MEKNIKKNKKGFTLVEVIVAMFVFVLIMSGSTMIFVKSFKNYGDAKDMQENIENAQYAMNIMAKTFRTSSVASSDGVDSSIVVYDYSQAEGTDEGMCIMYYFDSTSNELMRAEGGEAVLGDCDSSSVSGAEPVTSGNITGVRFDVEGSQTDSVVGKITVSITLEKGSNIVNLQTTTSLRDYVESGISL